MDQSVKCYVRRLHWENNEKLKFTGIKNNKNKKYSTRGKIGNVFTLKLNITVLNELFRMYNLLWYAFVKRRELIGSS